MMRTAVRTRNREADDLLGLISFLVTGLIITGLVAKARSQTEASRRLLKVR